MWSDMKVRDLITCSVYYECCFLERQNIWPYGRAENFQFYRLRRKNGTYTREDHY